MNDIEHKRQQVIGAYPSSRKWASKVAKMGEHQVLAIHGRLKSQNKIKN